MSTSIGPRVVDPAQAMADLGLRSMGLRRFAVRLAESLWMRDRAVAELRWAAITVLAMAVLGFLGKALDPAEHGFDRALLTAAPLAAALIALAWSGRAAGLMANRRIRLGLGPAVVIVGMFSAGSIDVVTLATPSAATLAWLALTFAAVTPGYPLALAIMIGSTIGVWIGHEFIVPNGTDVVRDEFLVGSAVVYLATTGMFVVVRIATAAEDRAARLAARLRRRFDDLEVLERIVRRFDGSRPVREVIQTVVDDVSTAFDIALVSIYLPEGERRLTMVGVAGYHSPFHVIDLGRGVIGRAASTRQTQFVPDVLQDPDYRAARDDVRNEVAVPIVHGEELLGVINFEGTLRYPLGTAHVAVAEMLGRSIAASLRSARLDEERRARLHAIERVLVVSRGLLSDLDRRRTVGAVVDAAVDLLRADRVFVAGRGRDGTFRLEGDSSDPGDGTWRSRALERGDTEALAAIAQGVPVVRAMVPGPIQPGGTVATSTMALPIRVADEVVAILVANRPADEPPFSELDRLIGDLLVTQIGVALHNADRHATVSDAAVRDPLTGLLNRRFFDEAVETAFATARRTGSPLSLIVLDLDRFSAVNNEHGHSAGDAVLRRVARAMADSVRNGDVVARYGGEEFVVISPCTSTEEAVVVAERIREAVAAADGSGADGPPVMITVSAGVASLLGDELDGKAVFRAADSALLAAKRAGRDRVMAV
ncbi:MAG: diguanylate cyclase [Candidatus Limnocylindrales bacterium]